MDRYAHGLAALALLLLVGCGGGGGTSIAFEKPESLLAGTYRIVGVSGDKGGIEEVDSYWGELQASGAGMLSLTVVQNALGVLSPPLPSSDIVYRVGYDRALEFDSSLPGVAAFHGAVSEAGDVAALMTTFTPIRPMLLLLGRSGPGYDVSSLIGTYHFGCYGATVGGPFNFVGWGSFVFDGAGGGTYELTVNQEGAIAGPANPLFSYTVSPDGAVSLDLGGGFVVNGSVVAGGEMVLAAGGDAPGDNPTTYVLLRQGAGYTDADLDGPYFMLGFGHGVATNSYRGFVGGVLADGAGSNQFAGLRNEDGVVTQDPADGFSSAVAPDGTITFTTAGGDVLRGAMSADRRFLIATGTTNLGGDAAFFFLLR